MKVSPPAPDTKVCAFPFGRMNLGKNNYVPCCDSWLSPALSIFDGETDSWNGQKMQMLRSRILQGDFRLCRRDLCQVPLVSIEELKKNPDIISHAPVAKENIRAMENGEVIMPFAPSSVGISADPRCNLKCSSCRSEYIFHLTKEQERDVKKAEYFLQTYRETIQVIKLSGDGEVLFSPWTRDLLKNATRDRFPNLHYIGIHSNGIFFDEKNFKALAPGSENIKSVTISIDAGNEAVYASVRGGDWQSLNANLRWISSLRQAKRINHFAMNFVVRRENFRSLPEFVSLANSLGVDKINITAPVPVPRAAGIDFKFESVHLPDHPEYREFVTIADSVRGQSNVRFATGGTFIDS